MGFRWRDLGRELSTIITLQKTQKRYRKASNYDNDDDEDFGAPRKRRVVVPKKPVLSKAALQNEPAGLKALRQYTSALRLGQVFECNGLMLSVVLVVSATSTPL